MEAQSPKETPLAPKNSAGDAGVLNRHRRLATFLALLAVAGAAAWLTYFYWPEPDRSPPMFNWYTVDDGATWFQDYAERPPLRARRKTRCATSSL